MAISQNGVLVALGITVNAIPQILIKQISLISNLNENFTSAKNFKCLKGIEGHKRLYIKGEKKNFCLVRIFSYTRKRA